MKAHTCGNDIQLALLYFRITPVSLQIPSPAEMHFGRRLKSTMVSHINKTLVSNLILGLILRTDIRLLIFLVNKYVQRWRVADTISPKISALTTMENIIRQQALCLISYRTSWILNCSSSPRTAGSVEVKSCSGRQKSYQQLSAGAASISVEDNYSCEKIFMSELIYHVSYLTDGCNSHHIHFFRQSMWCEFNLCN